MTVKLPPTGVPSWGEPGHEPWQRIVLPDPNEFERKLDNVPAPKINPLVFLMGMLGETVGSLVGKREPGVQQQNPYGGFDAISQMQQAETNKLLRELLEISKGKRDDKSQYPEVRFPKKTVNPPDFLMPKTFGPGESLSVNDFGELVDF